MKRALILLTFVLLSCTTARAGPVYQWTGTGQQAMGIVEPFTSPPVIDYLPTPYAASVTLTYSPDPTASLLSTQGDTSAFRAQFSLSILGGGSGFTSGSLTGEQPGVASIFLTVPQSGLDRIDFVALGDLGPHGQPPTGRIEVWAPAGTLSTSTALPLDLAAFQAYGLANLDGSFSYEHPNVPGSSGVTNWAGIAAGTLGVSSVPEPSTFTLLAMGGTLLLIGILVPNLNRKANPR